MNCAEYLPPSGALVKLIKAPRGSWATDGEVYRVTYAASQKAGKRGIWANSSVRLWSEDRESGTIDIAMFWRWAKWEEA